MKRTFEILLAVLSVSGAVVAKPLSMQPDYELRDGVLAAEVQILEIDAPSEIGGGRGAAAESVGSVRVRVSSDPGRVYRGFHQLGNEVELKLARGGPRTCASNLSKFVENGVKPLIVVRPGNEIAFVGVRHERDTGAVYRLNHWCDWNAAWMFSVGNRFGKRLPDSDLELMRGFEASAAEIRALLEDDYQRFALRVADYLTAAAKPGGDEIRGWIAQLGDESFPARQQAERQLLDAGAAALGPLLEAQRETPDSEIAARISVILMKLDPAAAAAKYSEALGRCATGDQVKVLNAALAACDEEREGLRLRITERLAALADPTIK